MIQVIRETHEAPQSIQGRIARAGGLNWLGEANFRVVWGGSRLGWVGGRWTDRDSNGNTVREVIGIRKVPKYLPADRWHIERWVSAAFYGSPAEWYARTIEVEDGTRVPALGPYPSRGEYEHCFTLSGPNGEFVPLTGAAAEWIARAIEWARRQSSGSSKSAIAAREERRDREWDSHANEVLDEAIVDLTV